MRGPAMDVDQGPSGSAATDHDLLQTGVAAHHSGGVLSRRRAEERLRAAEAPVCSSASSSTAKVPRRCSRYSTTAAAMWQNMDAAIFESEETWPQEAVDDVPGDWREAPGLHVAKRWGVDAGVEHPDRTGTVADDLADQPGQGSVVVVQAAVRQGVGGREILQHAEHPPVGIDAAAVWLADQRGGGPVADVASARARASSSSIPYSPPTLRQCFTGNALRAAVLSTGFASA